ncbi:MAG: sigma-70 family RNA polymerase sigma factor [Myxococcota bacterium]
MARTQLSPRTTLDRYRDSLGNVRTLGADEERELAREWRAGNQRAGQKIIEASLPFVIRVAREYIRWGAPLEDLVQQGNLGLLKAAEKYDPDKGCRLVTYASYWIRAEIRDYVVRHYRIVRLGTTRTERRAMRAFRRQGIEDYKELAEASGMPEARAEKLWPLLVQSDSSLDAQYGTQSAGVTRLEDGAASPEDIVHRQHTIAGVRDAMNEALNCLTDRERRIVETRILGEDPPTLEALGREMGVSKERVRQLEVRARAKLRNELAQFQPAA